MTDQETIQKITERLVGKRIRIYERPSNMYAVPGFVVDVPDDARVNIWIYQDSRKEAHAQALSWAKHNSSKLGYPIQDCGL